MTPICCRGAGPSHNGCRSDISRSRPRLNRTEEHVRSLDMPRQLHDRRTNCIPNSPQEYSVISQPLRFFSQEDAFHRFRCLRAELGPTKSIGQHVNFFAVHVEEDYAIICIYMQDDSLVSLLKAFMDQCHLSQADVAKAVRISQASVSRALAGNAKRHGGARAKLFRYMQNHTDPDDSSTKGNKKVMRAFEAVWDGSEAHALALARIIKASEGLRPMKRRGGQR